jgi:hypothetical protein
VFGIGNNVYEAWRIRYDEQKKVPQWQGDLSKEFLGWINTHPTEDIPHRYRGEYTNFIRTEIDKLFVEVNARDLVPIENPTVVVPTAPAGRPPVGVRPNPQMRGNEQAMIGVTHEWKGLVAWDETLRQALRDQYDWDTLPTSQQVRYANEDLWIYRALLKIIANTNKDAKEHLVASVKQIEALNIGPLVSLPTQFYVPAVPVGGVVTDGASEGGGEGAMPSDGGTLDPTGGLPPAPGQAGQGEGGDAAAAAMTPDQYTDAVLKHGRYVDAKGKPVGYSQPEPFAEFKIMPFEMHLLMDQRRIPDLLANCANSPLPVEVRQVGIVSTEQPLDTANAGGGQRQGRAGMMQLQQRPMMPARGGMPGGEGDMPGGRGMGGLMNRQPLQRGMEGGGGGALDLGSAVELRPADLHVEIRGVIYIFNPPDRSKGGKTPEPTAETPVAPAAPAAEAGAGG